ncbi:hypothetical protein N656DRAFT_767904 [Canariomyces notabilis]|uniref:Uncharacterized protein n=1 Tax=Canariomyces notabilis TaxID=2074819 RepID=A0AAN6TFP7_9PEZI|nr:hypothetical protein N656DRAFT_767904 [Canariomyces arenarius]
MAPSGSIVTSFASVSSSTTTSSFKSQCLEPARLIIDCPFPGCSEKIDGHHEALCQAHLRTLTKSSGSRDAASTNGARAPSGPAPSPNPSHQPRDCDSTGLSQSSPFSQGVATSKHKKLLLLRNPIVMRKTASVENVKAPPFIPQQPAPKPSTPPSRGESTLSPPSPEPVAPNLSVRSPPASPGPSQDGESPRKRQRLSPSTGHSPVSQMNGRATSRPSTAGAEPEEKADGPSVPQPQRRASVNSSQRLSKSPEKVARPTVKLASKNAVRRMPSQLSTLRFIDSPQDPVSSEPSDLLGPYVNGSAESILRTNRREKLSTFSLNEGVKDYWMGKINSSIPSGVQAEVLSGSPHHTQRISDPLNGQTKGPSPEKRRESQTTYQTIQFPSPAPLPTKRRRPPPTPKVVDASIFDALIYSQPLASTPPPGLQIDSTGIPGQPPIPTATETTEAAATASNDTTKAEKLPPDEPVFAGIDPRIHWPQSHSPAWLAAKQAEIEARGGRKANFGRAAHSLRAQLRRAERAEAAAAFEDTLPEKMAENPAWVRVLKRLKGANGNHGNGHGEDDAVENGVVNGTGGGGGGGHASGSGGEGVSGATAPNPRRGRGGKIGVRS